MKILQLMRVPYGKKQTRLEDREYQLVGEILGPVGTIQEWQERFPDAEFKIIEEETE